LISFSKQRLARTQRLSTRNGPGGKLIMSALATSGGHR
jgi:hypothetical protein